ncbi:MAG: HNH endonuclease [Paracoccaceae bacterium]
MNMILLDDTEVWLIDVLENYTEEARQRALSILDAARETETGCKVTDTAAPRKVRFRGRQMTAYRFVFCILTNTVAGYDQVVRHRCHNRQCINPEHLEIGSRADNKRDDWERMANGVDYDFL